VVVGPPVSSTRAVRTAESRMLDMIRRDALGYFLHETNRAKFNGGWLEARP